MSNYTTRDDVKTSLGIPDTVTVDDAAIDAAIAAAELLIDNYTGRSFVAASATRTYLPRTVRIVDIDDLTSVTAGLTVKTDPNNDGTYETTLVYGTDFVAVGNDAPYRQLVNVNGGWPLSQAGRPTIEITGVFGYAAAVPANIKQAALLMSCRLFQRKASPLGFQAGAISEFGPVRISRTDPDVAALLQGVKLIGVG